MFSAIFQLLLVVFTLARVQLVICSIWVFHFSNKAKLSLK